MIEIRCVVLLRGGPLDGEELVLQLGPDRLPPDRLQLPVEPPPPSLDDLASTLYPGECGVSTALYQLGQVSTVQFTPAQALQHDVAPGRHAYRANYQHARN